VIKKDNIMENGKVIINSLICNAGVLVKLLEANYEAK
jgi:hypothetical protein